MMKRAEKCLLHSLGSAEEMDYYFLESAPSSTTSGALASVSHNQGETPLLLIFESHFFFFNLLLLKG